MPRSKPYFNDHQGLYAGSEPPFYEIAAVPGAALLEANWRIIRDELEANLADPDIARELFRKWTLKKVAGWRQIELRVYGVDYPARMRFFPRTLDVINRLEGAATVYFSVLAPHSGIKAHVGDTDAFHRVHLGLRIPAPLPLCGLQVAGEQRSWEEGRCVAFNDIYCHSAWNDSDAERIVLIVDLLRPEFRGRETYVNSGVRATLYYSRLYEIFFPVVELMPRLLTRLGNPLFRFFSYWTHIMRSRINRFR